MGHKPFTENHCACVWWITPFDFDICNATEFIIDFFQTKICFLSAQTEPTIMMPFFPSMFCVFQMWCSLVLIIYVFSWLMLSYWVFSNTKGQETKHQFLRRQANLPDSKRLLKRAQCMVLSVAFDLFWVIAFGSKSALECTAQKAQFPLLK